MLAMTSDRSNVHLDIAAFASVVKDTGDVMFGRSSRDFAEEEAVDENELKPRGVARERKFLGAKAANKEDEDASGLTTGPISTDRVRLVRAPTLRVVSLNISNNSVRSLKFLHFHVPFSTIYSTWQSQRRQRL